MRRSFTTACRKAGVEGFRFHDLRHTIASQLVMNGVGLKAVQELLGHSVLKMTMRYAHLSQAHLQEAVAVLKKFGDGHQMDTKGPKTKKADNPSIANPLKSLSKYGRDGRIRTADFLLPKQAR